MRLAWRSAALPDSVPAAPKARSLGEAPPGQSHRRGCHRASSWCGLRVGHPRLDTEQACHQPATARRYRPDAGMPKPICSQQRDNRAQTNRRPYRSRQIKHPDRRTLLLSMSSAPARTAMCARQAAPLIRSARTIVTAEAMFLLANVGGDAGQSRSKSIDRHGAAFMRPKPSCIGSRRRKPVPTIRRALRGNLVIIGRSGKTVRRCGQE